MPRVNFVKKERKANKEYGIKKGDSYYWWKFNFGPKIVSKTPPKRSQLTRSDFLSQLYDLEDSIGEFQADSEDDIRSGIEEFTGMIDDLINECQERLDNMPDHLRESSSSGQTLQERIDQLESWKSDLESVDTTVDDELEEKTVDKREEEKKQKIEEILDEIKGTSSGL